MSLGGPDERDHGAKGFLQDQFARMRNVVDDRRRIERPFAVIPVKQASTVLYGSLDRTLELFCSVFMNDGSNIHRGIHRITAFELFGSFEHLLRKLVRDRFHAKDALDRRTALARILGGTKH